MFPLTTRPPNSTKHSYCTEKPLLLKEFLWHLREHVECYPGIYIHNNNFPSILQVEMKKHTIHIPKDVLDKAVPGGLSPEAPFFVHNTNNQELEVEVMSISSPFSVDGTHEVVTLSVGDHVVYRPSLKMKEVFGSGAVKRVEGEMVLRTSLGNIRVALEAVLVNAGAAILENEGEEKPAGSTSNPAFSETHDPPFVREGDELVFVRPGIEIRMPADISVFTSSDGEAIPLEVQLSNTHSSMDLAAALSPSMHSRIKLSNCDALKPGESCTAQVMYLPSEKEKTAGKAVARDLFLLYWHYLDPSHASFFERCHIPRLLWRQLPPEEVLIEDEKVSVTLEHGAPLLLFGDSRSAEHCKVGQQLVVENLQYNTVDYGLSFLLSAPKVSPNIMLKFDESSFKHMNVGVDDMEFLTFPFSVNTEASSLGGTHPIYGGALDFYAAGKRCKIPYAILKCREDELVRQNVGDLQIIRPARMVLRSSDFGKCSEYEPFVVKNTGNTSIEGDIGTDDTSLTFSTNSFELSPGSHLIVLVYFRSGDTVPSATEADIVVSYENCSSSDSFAVLKVTGEPNNKLTPGSQEGEVVPGVDAAEVSFPGADSDSTSVSIVPKEMSEAEKMGLKTIGFSVPLGVQIYARQKQAHAVVGSNNLGVGEFWLETGKFGVAENDSTSTMITQISASDGVAVSFLSEGSFLQVHNGTLEKVSVRVYVPPGMSKKVVWVSLFVGLDDVRIPLRLLQEGEIAPVGMREAKEKGMEITSEHLFENELLMKNGALIVNFDLLVTDGPKDLFIKGFSLPDGVEVLMTHEDVDDFETLAFYSNTSGADVYNSHLPVGAAYRVFFKVDPEHENLVLADKEQVGVVVMMTDRGPVEISLRWFMKM
jgi:hypothetical protein